MDDEVIGRIEIDPRLEQYRTFFGHEWCRDTASIVTGTKLDQPFLTLVINWRAAANTHTMPWLFIHSLNQFWHGAVKHQNLTARLISALADRIPNKMPGKATNMMRKKIAQAVREIAAEVEEAWKNDPDTEMEPEVLWQGYIHQTSNVEFQAAIWGSQRLVFGALFFAFEHFVTTLVAIGLGKNEDKYRPNWNVLVSDAKKLFDPVDPTLVPTHLDSQFITITRLARNCLAHRAGKISTELAQLNHGLLLDTEGVIQINPSYNQQCIRQLENRLTAVIEAAVKLPAFKL